MAAREIKRPAGDVDGLRLLALGRIPRCRDCPRYHGLLAAYAAAGHSAERLPEAPKRCKHRVCRPMVARYDVAAGRGPRLPRRLIAS